MVSGVASAVVLVWYGWWQAILLVLAWSATHWLLRESAIWRDRRTPEVQRAQRHAEYSYRLAVDPPAAKEVRLFGLADWVIERFTSQRRRLYDLQHEATRLREKSVLGCLLIVAGGQPVVAFWSLADRAADGRLDLAAAIVALQAAIGVSAIAFGGLNWALDGAAAPVAAVVRLESVMPPAGALAAVDGSAPTPTGTGPELRFRHVSFGYPGGPLVLDGFDLTIPAGTSLAIVGQNGAGKTTLAKLLCRLYDPVSGAVEVDGTDLRQLDLDGWRAGVTAVFQDFVRFELPLRDNVAPGGGRDEDIVAALHAAGAGRPGRARHDPGQGLSRRHRPVGRAVAARRPGAGPVRRARRRRRRPARRADGPARRARRGGDLRAHPRRHPGVHDDPHLAPLLDRAPRRSHLRARAGRRRRARDARRADGARAADTARCSTSRRRGSSSSTSTGRRSSMSPSTDVPDDLPPAIPALWRTFMFGYRAEPRLLLASLGTTLLMMLPDALLALWLKMLTDGVLDGDRTVIVTAAIGLAVSTTATWYIRIVNDRLSRRFRDRLAIAIEAHIAHLQATVPTVEHQERPDHLDRLAVLRNQSFALDHLFSSLLSNIGWVFRLGVTAVLLASIHPALALLLLAGLPAVLTSLWRPGVERAVEESVAAHDRLARHLFVVATTPAPAKEVRVTGIGDDLRARRRAARERWQRPIAAARWVSAAWTSLAWAIFGIAYAAGIAWVARGLDRSVGDVVLVVVAGQRLSQYIAQTVGELGFLRGVWLDSSLRLTWLEDYAAALDQDATSEPPPAAHRRHPLRARLVPLRRRRSPGRGRHRPAPAGRCRSSPSSARTAPASRRSSSCSPGCTGRRAGRITVDGVDLATISSSAWRARLAGAFQDFFRFELVARQSVGVGDEPRLDDEPAVGRAVGRAGADDDVGRLPAGLGTQLGPTWEDGVEVSFGQWQKLALARGFMRDDPLVLVLDEPTAALDAETEHALFERYAEASRGDVANGRVTILVSHRFSTVRMADLIVVLDGARVVEVGRHDELVARGGQYAELFAIQAGAYR